MSSSKKSHAGEDTGEPGCKSLAEVGKMFQHFWDPTAFWECEAPGKSAILSRCAQSQLFSGQKGKCVHYTEWEWSEPTEPLSRPNAK